MNTLYELIQHQLDQRIKYKDDPEALEHLDDRINTLTSILFIHTYE